MVSSGRRLRSVRRACLAPRLSASIPTAPVPAKASHQRRSENIRSNDVEQRFFDAIRDRASQIAGNGLQPVGPWLSPRSPSWSAREPRQAANFWARGHARRRAGCRAEQSQERRSPCSGASAPCACLIWLRLPPPSHPEPEPKVSVLPGQSAAERASPHVARLIQGGTRLAVMPVDDVCGIVTNGFESEPLHRGCEARCTTCPLQSPAAGDRRRG